MHFQVTTTKFDCKWKKGVLFFKMKKQKKNVFITHIITCLRKKYKCMATRSQFRNLFLIHNGLKWMGHDEMLADMWPSLKKNGM